MAICEKATISSACGRCMYLLSRSSHVSFGQPKPNVCFESDFCKPGPRVYKKIFFMLNSAENEICSANKKLNTSNLNFLPVMQSWEWNFFQRINIKMPTNVGILIFISRKKFVLKWVEYEKSFITSGPELSSFEI